MNSAQSFPNQNGSPAHSPEEQPAELLSIDEVMAQDDVALLKSQLAAAHQLLHYQKNLVHSLTEQVQIKEMHLKHSERQVDELQQNCQSQTVELAEMRSICADLRSLLKRQTRRPGQSAVTPTCTAAPRTLGFEMQAPPPVRTSISFGYESTSPLTPESHRLTKAPPVKAWSAPNTEEFREEITFCQKLTTFIMSSASRVTHAEATSVSASMIEMAAQSVALSAHEPSSVRSRSVSTHQGVELPRFAVG